MLIGCLADQFYFLFRSLYRTFSRNLLRYFSFIYQVFDESDVVSGRKSSRPKSTVPSLISISEAEFEAG